MRSTFVVDCCVGLRVFASGSVSQRHLLASRLANHPLNPSSGILRGGFVHPYLHTLPKILSQDATNKRASGRDAAISYPGSDIIILTRLRASGSCLLRYPAKDTNPFPPQNPNVAAKILGLH
jgi:hypothetical protein